MTIRHLEIDGSDVRFKLHRVLGDGACFYNTLSLGLYGTPVYTRNIRTDIVNFVSENYHHYEEFILNHITGEPMTVDEYRDYMLQPYSFATHVEVTAASALYRLRIIVFEEGRLFSEDGLLEWQTVVAEFSGHRDRGHFDLLQPVTVPLPSPPLPYTSPDGTDRGPIQFFEQDSEEPSIQVYPSDNDDHSPEPTSASTRKRKAGRPKKVKRGRPKTSNLTPKEQNLQANKRYSKKNPEVNKKATARYNANNPDGNRRAVQSYTERNPHVNRDAVRRYTNHNPQIHREAVRHYSERNPQINREAVRRYKDNNYEKRNEDLRRHREVNADNLGSVRQVPKSVRNEGLIGEFSGSNLNKIRLYNFKNTSLISSNAYKCPHCKAPLFDEEKGRKKWCCSEGANNVSVLPELEADFYSTPEFLKHSRAYNNLHAFSALGVSHGFKQPNTGTSFVKIQGRTYHRVFDLSYAETTNPGGMYIDDGEERSRIAAGMSLNQEVVQAVSNYLHATNPFIVLFKRLSEEPSEDAHLIFESTTRRTHGPVLGDVPRGSEIAAIISTEREQYNPRQIVIWKVGASKPHTVDVFHPLYECLQYPIIYPHGTPGWHIGMSDSHGKKLSQVKYYRSLLLAEPRFTNLGRLSEEWLVDMYCRVEEERLRYISRTQSKNTGLGMRTAPLNELQVAIDRNVVANVTRALGTDETIQGEGGVVPGRIYLPNTFTGGPRYMKTKYLDGMSIVARLGKPSYFLTITCNPKWPEILESTPAGHKPSAELVARVFKLKLMELLRDLRCGAYFGKKVYMLYVIEFQKRGLPHAHICYRVEGGGPKDNIEIDKVVRADIPHEAEAEGRLRALVLAHMVHGPCGPSHRKDLPCWDDSLGKCTKHFPKSQCDTTHVDERGFVHYRRDINNSADIRYRRRNVAVNDTWVVPYNSVMLLKFDCHINLEIASTRKIVKYLFKYITKGPDEARVAVVPKEELLNEVETYVTKRYIGACDAAWRMLEFDISGREPNVMQLPVHLEGQHSVFFRPGEELDAARKSSSNLLIYFNRPHGTDFDQLTYLDFFENFIVHSKQPKTNVPVVPHPDGTHFITKRQRGEMVTRLFWVSPSRGEQFYLRLLLINFASRGYSDLIAHGGEGCTTFQGAARALGLVNDELEYEVALQEASQFMTGSRLRQFFVLILVAGARGADLWETFKNTLSEDLQERIPDNPEQAYTTALIQIDRSLRRHGACLRDHGLPEVHDDSTELRRELVQHSLIETSSFADEWIPKLCLDQKVIFDYVLSLLNPTLCDKKAIFIDGPAGTGKTLLLKVLTSSLRAKRHIVLCTASSGIAAQNYEGGTTAHSMFKLPLDIDHNTYWGVSGGSQRAELIRAASVIIFDEAPMAHNKVIHTLERSLRDLMQCNEPFGGKIIIFAGDFRQIPPVVLGAKSISEVVSASLRCSPLWTVLKPFTLSDPQRAREDTKYASYLLNIGNGSKKVTTVGEGRSREQLISLDNIRYVTDEVELIENVFPLVLLQDPDACAQRAILCVTNDSVDNVNTNILIKVPGEPVSLLSANYFEDSNVDEVLLSSDALEHVHAKGVPDHNLILKINCVCIITRNLNFEDALLNGTKVIVVGISHRLVRVRKPFGSQIYSIPRITFLASVEPNSPLKFYRRQFPLRVSYAITINKSQGQTINYVGVDLRSDVFSHGQLYVALGRVRSSDSLLVLIRPDRVFNGLPHVKNVIYKQLLQ